MVNLGNVAGVVISDNPPLEADGITVKKYVWWAKPINSLANPLANQDDILPSGEFVLYYWNYMAGDWTTVNPQNLINDSMVAAQITSTKTFSKTKILQLINAVNKVVPFGEFTIYKGQGNTGSVLQAGDVIVGLWEYDLYIVAKYLGDVTGNGIQDIANYKVGVKQSFDD